MCNLSQYQKELWNLQGKFSQGVYYLVALVAQCKQPLHCRENVMSFSLCADWQIILHLHAGMVDVGVHWELQSQVIEMAWLVDAPDETNSIAKPHSYSK